MQDFISPKKAVFLPWFAKTFIRTILKGVHNINEINISLDDTEKIKTLKDKRVILIANHPSTIEPHLIFFLSTILEQKMEFMASRQVFEWSGGLIGYVIRRLGAYSIIAGINDKKALYHTVKLLSKKNAKLTIFPEGEPTSGENTTFMPFQQGFAVLSLLSLERLKAKEPNADILILPVSFFYTLNIPKEFMIKNLEKRLNKLENKTQFTKTKNEQDIVKRILKLGYNVLEKFEKKYGVQIEEGETFKHRVGRLRHKILNELAQLFRVKNYNQDGNAIEKFRNIFSIVELCMINYKDDSLPKLTKKELKAAFKKLFNVFEMIIINEEHLLTKPSFEKCFEWIERYETLLLDKKPRALGGRPSTLPRKAHIQLGETFSLAKYSSKNKKERMKRIDSLMEKSDNTLKSMIKESESLSHFITSE